MRISDIILESEQLDEISLAGVGQGIGKFASGVGKTVGGAIGGVKAAGTAVKRGYQQGYQGAQQSILGKDDEADAVSAPTAKPGPAGTTGSATPQTTAQPVAAQPATPRVTVAQINSAIPALRTRDLQSIKKTVDAALAKKQPAAVPPAAPAAQPKLKVQPGGAVK